MTVVASKKQGVGRPAWRRAFDRVERTVGKPLEDVAGSQRYIRTALVGRGGAAARAAGARAAGCGGTAPAG